MPSRSIGRRHNAHVSASSSTGRLKAKGGFGFDLSLIEHRLPPLPLAAPASDEKAPLLPEPPPRDAWRARSPALNATTPAREDPPGASSARLARPTPLPRRSARDGRGPAAPSSARATLLVRPGRCWAATCAGGRSSAGDRV